MFLLTYLIAQHYLKGWNKGSLSGDCRGIYLVTMTFSFSASIFTEFPVSTFSSGGLSKSYTNGISDATAPDITGPYAYELAVIMAFVLLSVKLKKYDINPAIASSPSNRIKEFQRSMCRSMTLNAF